MIKIFRLLPILLLMCGLWLFPVTSVWADGETDVDKSDISISLSPTGTLFDINNMKPGDWAPRTLIVENSGAKDFVYHMQVQNKGEKKLFNELLLEIKLGEKELYQGKLAAFKALLPRELASGSKENLDITIRFPEHLGNDFQGLQAAFVFYFTTQRKNNSSVPPIVEEQPGDQTGGNPGGQTEIQNEEQTEVPIVDQKENQTEEQTVDQTEEQTEEQTEAQTEEQNEVQPVEQTEDPKEGQGQTKGQIEVKIDSSGLAPAGGNLPATSTNLFNLILLGSVLVASGILLMIIRYYRRMKLAQQTQ